MISNDLTHIPMRSVLPNLANVTASNRPAERGMQDPNGILILPVSPTPFPTVWVMKVADGDAVDGVGGELC